MTVKRTMGKSLLSLALALVFMFSFIPMAFAADGDIIVTTGEELDAALQTAVGTANVTIVLANDIDAVTSATYTAYTTGAAITIDGQGHTINGQNIMDTGLRFGARGQELILNITNTAFANMQNNDRNGGGAIAMWRGVANVSGGTFTGNVSTNSNTRGGAGIMVQSGSANISSSTFTGNTAAGNGAAIFATSGTLTNVTVTGNHSERGVGGVNGTFKLFDSIIEGNTTDSATANPNVSANVFVAANAAGLAINESVSGYSIAGISLISNLSLDNVNLIEATIKYSPAQVKVDGAVAVNGATINRFDVDAGRGLIDIVIGVTGMSAIASNGPTSIVDVLATSLCEDDISYFSLVSFAAYSAGETVTDVSVGPDTVIASFTYAPPLDVNADGVVNAKDLSLALYRFGAIAADDNWDDVKSADLNGDGAIDIIDITMLVDALYA